MGTEDRDERGCGEVGGVGMLPEAVCRVPVSAVGPGYAVLTDELYSC